MVRGQMIQAFGRTDKVQSTALAVIALMNYTQNQKIYRYDHAVRTAVLDI
jgi:hypothetical protein